MANLEIGTKVYYTGDMANDEGHGTIIGERDGRYIVRLEDGRIFRPLPIGVAKRYDGSGRYRFVTEGAYEAWREEGRKRMMEFYYKMHPEERPVEA